MAFAAPIRSLFLPLLLLLFTPTGGFAAYSGEYPYTVTATTGMVGDIVRAVAGDRGNVTDIIKPGVDPHLYKPSREAIVLLTRADVVFYSGLLLEGQMSVMLSRLSKSKPVYAVTELIPKDQLILLTGHPDPHVWMDVSKWHMAVDAVADSLCEFDPPNTTEYRERAKAYGLRLMELHGYAKKVLASIPEERRVMITAHDAFNYMGETYGLEVLGIQGLSTESEAGLQDINGLVDMIVSRKIPAVFVETSVSDKNVKALVEGARSRGHDVIVGGSLFSDAMGLADTYEGTYLGMIDHNVTTIANALGGEAPVKGWQGKLSAHIGDGK